MSSVKLPRSLSAVALGAALLATAPALAETLVVRASGPSAGTFAPGKKLADGVSVTLKSGDVLTLLDGRGTQTLRGPGTFGTGGNSTSSASSTRVASFLGSSGASRARTGAVRGPGEAPKPGNVWLVDTTTPSTVCIANPQAVMLWAPPPEADQTLTITGKSAKAQVVFAAGKAQTPWPVELPVAEGAEYILTGGDLKKPTAITLTLLPENAVGLEGAASILIARKCSAQLDLLVSTFAMVDPAPDMPN